MVLINLQNLCQHLKRACIIRAWKAGCCRPQASTIVLLERKVIWISDIWKWVGSRKYWLERRKPWSMRPMARVKWPICKINCYNNHQLLITVSRKWKLLVLLPVTLSSTILFKNHNSNPPLHPSHRFCHHQFNQLCRFRGMAIYLQFQSSIGDDLCLQYQTCMIH